jgi:hypothetical protein
VSEIIEVDAVEPAGPEADLPIADALIETYVPKSDEVISLDEFQQRGISLGEYVRQAGIALGGLVEWGWAELRPTLTWNGEKIEKINAWCAFCAMLWGFSRSTVVKAWVVWNVRQSGIDVPQELQPTVLYELSSGGLKGDALEAVLGRATDENWSAWDTREIKKLVKAGLLKNWQRVSLIKQDDKLFAAVGKKLSHFATLTNTEGYAAAGRALLLSRARIKEKDDGDEKTD